ncbi:MAG: restriction endonuclease subunit S [Atribacterota bacterium]|nr:restriction endonuclease subunit S [Atribacterota bacterium]
MTQTEAIPTGYKKTEVGIIPEDWNVKTLVEVSENVKVGLATSVTKYYRNKGIPIIRNLNIKDGFFDDRDMLYLDEDFAKANLSKSAKGLDVLTVHTGANLGLTCVLPKRYDKCQTFTTLITTPKKSIIDSYYLCYHMCSFFGKKEMKKLEVGGGKGNLNTADLKKYRIFFPPNINEQKAIARVLSDTDALIESLEKLIAKKKAIKQGAMQQLLNGKKRLPGFSGEWGTKKFKEKYVTNLITCGLAATPQYVPENNGIPFLSSTNIKNGKVIWTNFKYISKDLHRQLYRNNPPLKGDILYSRVGTIGEAAIVNVDFEFSIYVSLTLIKPGKLLHNEFTKQLLNSYTYKTLAKNTVFLGGGVGNLNVNVVREFPISFPSFKEQTAIANILSDMDSEIEKLEQKKDKYNLLKQGMMQQLLTGKIRLVKNGDN